MGIKLEKKECDCNIDQLTGLCNRQALLEYITTDKLFTIFIIDIDNFANINHRYDFKTGDQILINFAEYLKRLKPADGQLFRFSGDRFVYLSDKNLSNDEKEEFAQLLISFFSDIELFSDDYKTIKVFLSIGIYTGRGEKLLKFGTFALNDVRKYRKNDYKIFDLSSNYIKQQIESIQWINNVREYLEEEKFTLFYQPIQNNKIGKVDKYECLIRIKNDDRVISPISFMDACKETGILERITRFVINNAFEKFAGTKYSFSINITSEDINLGYLEDFLLKKSQKYNVEPSSVILEILEDITALTEPHMMTQLDSLRKQGFKIALDDFGVENSNFARLIELRPDFIKIDGVFIRNIVADKNSQIIVKTIADFCKSCEIEMIAEFVHDEDVHKKVQEYGIEFSQGYFIGMPKEEI